MSMLTCSAMTSTGDHLILLAPEGPPLEVEGDAAVSLDIEPPSNGWDATQAVGSRLSEDGLIYLAPCKCEIDDIYVPIAI